MVSWLILKNITMKEVIFILLAIPFFLFSLEVYAQHDDINVRVELLYPEGVELLEPQSTLSAKVCFDLLRAENNYFFAFHYQLFLLCNGKRVARETLTYEPPEGIAIRRTTICKTFKFALEDFIKPESSMITLKAYVEVKEADRKKIKGESKSVEAKLISEYEELSVSGKVICPSDLPLSLVRIDFFGLEPGSKTVPRGSHTFTFTDRLGNFSTALPSPLREGFQIIAQLSCPGEDFPSLTIIGNVSDNNCSFGSITLSCLPCSGAVSAGEMEQMLPPRSPASVNSRFEFIKR